MNRRSCSTGQALEKQMTLIELASAQPASSLFSAAMRRFGNWRSARRAAREQHLALQSLLFMPQHRLRDLGISQEQLIQAMEIHRK
jgi:uncharacterized protein YjiS (DUF1127 family)